jgi:hypothetical protein
MDSVVSSPPVVRKARPEDEESIWELFHLMHEETGAFEIDYPKVQNLLNRILYSERIPPGDLGVRGYMGVIGPLGKIEAFTLMIIGSYWYSSQWTLEELANFVHPDHRKGTEHATTLLQYDKMLSDKLQIPLIIGIISNVRTEAKVRLYRRMFGKEGTAGAFFVHNTKFGKELKKVANG